LNLLGCKYKIDLAANKKNNPSAGQASVTVKRGPDSYRSRGTNKKTGIGGTLSSNPRKAFNVCIALIVVTILVYANTLQNGYVLDDMAVIENNTLVKQGFSGIPELLITPRFQGFEHIVNDSYRPLSLVTFAIEYQLFGPNPAVGHLFNILFFAACVVLLFLFLDKLFNQKKTGIAFIAALLFAVHPVHTEVVANIKSSDELLCFFFAFWSLNVFLGYIQQGKQRQLIIGTLLLFLSFLCKETVIAFLFVIPLALFLYRNEHKKRSLFVIIATLLVSLAFLVARAIVLKANDSGAIPFLDNPLVHAPLFSTRIPTAIMVLGIYLRLLFVPYPLISDYSYNTIPSITLGANFGTAAMLLSLLIYLLIATVGIYRLLKKVVPPDEVGSSLEVMSPVEVVSPVEPKDPLAFGILFFLSTIALFSNIPFLVYSEMAERLLFFASAGFCLGITAILWQFLGRPTQEKQNGLVPPKIWFVIAPIGLVFAALTISRNADWKTNYALTVSDIKKAPYNARLWHSMGYLLLATKATEEPDPAVKQQMVSEGIADLQRSLSIYPDNAKAHQDLGNFFRDMQQYDSAETHLKLAVKLNPTSYVPVSDLGYVYFCEKKYHEALALSQAALLQDKKNVDIINNMAMCYLQMHQYDSSLIMIKQALAIDPGNKLSNEYLAMVNNASGGTTPK